MKKRRIEVRFEGEVRGDIAYMLREEAPGKGGAKRKGYSQGWQREVMGQDMRGGRWAVGGSKVMKGLEDQGKVFGS